MIELNDFYLNLMDKIASNKGLLLFIIVHQ